MEDERLDPRLSALARAHNRPPETPREAIWDGIQRSRLRRPRHRWIPMAAAAAAILAIGVGIGRLSSGSPELPPTSAVLPDVGPSEGGIAYRLAAMEHLGRSEAFLTRFRASVARGGDHHPASATARGLLATNRLLLDSPAAADRQIRLLLEDLELVLAGIAQLSPASQAQDLELVRDGIERGDVLPRLRTALPAAAGATPTRGAL